MNEAQQTQTSWRAQEGCGRIWIWDSRGAYIAELTYHQNGVPSQEETMERARLLASAPDLKAQRDDLLAALREISKGEGRFSRDPLEHAGTTVDHMKAIARAAIAKYEKGADGAPTP